jgi:acetyltransferase
VKDLDVFLNPQSVALIGVSQRTGKGAFNIMENIVNYGFKGKIYPVHPRADEILGVKTFRRVEDLPEGVELGIIAIPREGVPAIVSSCARKGVKGLIIVTQGFADADAKGKELQSQIDSVVKEKGIRIIGPNTLGVDNPFSHFGAFFVPLMRREKVPTAFVSQTGAFVQPAYALAPLGKGIDLGNACDISFADVLEYLEDDEDTKIITLYIEGVKDGRRFIETARRVASKKPILALKAGRSAKGAEKTTSHSGSLAGQDEVCDAAFKQAGIVRISDFDEQQDYVKAFLKLPPLKGHSIGVVTISGAAGVMATDSLEFYGLQLSELSNETKESLQRLSPDWMSIDNPMDVWVASMSHGYKDVMRATMSAILSDLKVDGIVIYNNCPEPLEEGFFNIAPEIEQLTSTGVDKPIAIVAYGAYGEALANELEKNPKVVTFPTISRAVRALSFLRRYNEIRRKAV